MTRQLKRDAEARSDAMSSQVEVLTRAVADTEKTRNELQQSLDECEEDQRRMYLAFQSRDALRDAEVSVLRDRVLALELHMANATEVIKSQENFMGRLKHAVNPLIRCAICIEDYGDSKIPAT
ncbi:hypothetical protein BDZ89DRAFT_1055536 [Hymenopellis radicata]|nr:hypothetical protein BDZ89DRAFT_1055536 [Hymenopellis radicata]